MAWNCPYAAPKKCINNSLVCRKIMKQGIDYNLPQNCYSVFCACQRYCKTEKRVVNSDEAKKCYEYHSQQA